MKKITLLLVIIGLCFSPSVWAAQTYALIIGVNQYEKSEKIINLKGAVNDANAIYDALHFIGVPKKNLVRLLNEEATKKQIKTQWQTLVSGSKAGDTLIFSFAGHGMQENDINKDEAQRDPKDTLDETLLLGGFAELPKKAHQERLVDDELHRLFLMAKDRRVIYVADSCHSGESFRSVNKKFAKHQWQARYVPTLSKLTYTPADDSNVLVANELELEDFYFFASTESRKKSLEGLIDVDGVATHHGALSWAFAQALRDTQLGEDGEIKLTELANYINTQVKNATESRQFTDIQPRSGKETLFSIKKSQQSQAENDVAKKKRPTLRLETKGDAPDWLQQLEHLTLTTENADFIWDIRNKTVYNKHSDLTASGIEQRHHLQKLLERWQLIHIIDRLSKGHFVATQLSAKTAKQDKNEHAKLHKIGDKIEFSLSDLTFNQLLQFNLAGDGTVQCFKQNQVEQEKSYRFSAEKPIGNDSLISLIINQPSDALKRLLDRNRACASALEISQALPELLAGKDYQLGRIDTFVGDRE